MSNRLNQERQERLEPKRIQHAVDLIESIGYEITIRTDKSIQFYFNNSIVTVWPYSGWCSGKTINDCRGIRKLIAQITPPDNSNIQPDQSGLL